MRGSENNKFIAHKRKSDGEHQLLEIHLKEVGEIAGQFAQKIGSDGGKGACFWSENKTSIKFSHGKRSHAIWIPNRGYRILGHVN